MRPKTLPEILKLVHLQESRSCFFFFKRFERSQRIVSPSKAPNSIILCWNDAGAPTMGSVYLGSEKEGNNMLGD